MDERTSLLICLGAATAVNCIPCFEHYFKKADSAGLTLQEIQEAVELATKVKNGAHLVLRNGIRNYLGQEGTNPQCGSSPSKATCCG